MRRLLAAIVILGVAGCSSEEPVTPPSTAAVAAGHSSRTNEAGSSRASVTIERTTRLPRRTVDEVRPRLAAAAVERNRRPARFADLMTRAMPLVPREEQRRWLDLRRRVGGAEAPDLARLSPDDRRAFDEIAAALEHESPTHPVVAEILRRARDAS